MTREDKIKLQIAIDDFMNRYGLKETRSYINDSLLNHNPLDQLQEELRVYNENKEWPLSIVMFADGSVMLQEYGGLIGKTFKSLSELFEWLKEQNKK